MPRVMVTAFSAWTQAPIFCPTPDFQPSPLAGGAKPGQVLQAKKEYTPIVPWLARREAKGLYQQKRGLFSRRARPGQ
jgi:hypothetical protein